MGDCRLNFAQKRRRSALARRRGQIVFLAYAPFYFACKNAPSVESEASSGTGRSIKLCRRIRGVRVAKI
jgi:hypothetical protein